MTMTGNKKLTVVYLINNLKKELNHMNIKEIITDS